MNEEYEEWREHILLMGLSNQFILGRTSIGDMPRMTLFVALSRWIPESNIDLKMLSFSYSIHESLFVRGRRFVVGDMGQLVRWYLNCPVFRIYLISDSRLDF